MTSDRHDRDYLLEHLESTPGYVSPTVPPPSESGLYRAVEHVGTAAAFLDCAVIAVQQAQRDHQPYDRARIDGIRHALAEYTEHTYQLRSALDAYGCTCGLAGGEDVQPA